MNRIYKTIWNKSLGRMVVTAETARSHMTSSSCTADKSTGLGSCLTVLAMLVGSVMGSAPALAITCTDGSGTNATVCGVNNTASATQSSAIGYSNTASGSNSFAAGGYALATQSGATAIGAKSSGYLDIQYDAGNTKIIAINNVPVTATTTSTSSITAINGVSVTSQQVSQFVDTIDNGGSIAYAGNATALGAQNIAAGQNSSAVGNGNVTTGYSAAAIGIGNLAASGGVSVGSANTANSGVAMGAANISSNNGVAVGRSNNADFGNAFGSNNSVKDAYATAMGYGNVAATYMSNAFGVNSMAYGYRSFAAGNHAISNGWGSTVLGAASGNSYVNIQYDGTGKINSLNGMLVTATGATIDTISSINGKAVTQEEAWNYYFSLDRGGSLALGDASLALGSQNVAAGGHAVAVGYNNNNRGGDSSAFGNANQISGSNSSAIGYANSVSGSSSNAVGNSNRATGSNSNAFGSANTASGLHSVAAGSYNLAVQGGTTAIGGASNYSYASIQYNEDNSRIIAVNGIPVYSTGNTTASITQINGQSVTVDQVNQFLSSLNYGGSIALGVQSTTLGAQNIAAASNSTAIGFNNVASGTNSSVLGVDSKATAQNSTALGYDSVADRASTISVGRAGAEKQIVNVKAATQDTDAVNLFQVSAVASALGGGAGFSNGVFTAPSYTIQGSSYNNVGGALSAVNVKLDSLQGQIDGLSGSSLMAVSVQAIEPADSNKATTEVAAGSSTQQTAAAAPQSAGTVTATPKDGIILGPITTVDSQTLEQAKTYTTQQTQQAVKSANAYTDTRVDALNSRFDAFQSDVDKRLNTQEKKINQTGAISSAFTGMAMNAAGLSGKNRVAIGFGGQGSETAVAVGYQIAPTQNTSVSIGGAISDSIKALSAGVGFSW